MTPTISLVNIIIYGLTLFTISSQAQSRSGNDDTYGDDLPSGDANTVSVKLVTRRGQDFSQSISINPDGQLASRILSPAHDILGATVESERPIVCFLGRNGDERTAQPDELLSRPFTATKELAQPFSRAEELYCYDESRDRQAGNVYTLFLENRRGQKELVRVPIRNRSERSRADSELDIVAEYPTLVIDVSKAMIVTYPGASTEGMDEQKFCLLFTSESEEPTLSWANQVSLFYPQTNLLKILCRS